MQMSSYNDRMKQMIRVTGDDLAKVRIKCLGTVEGEGGKNEPCGAIYEIDYKALATFFTNKKCLRCGQEYYFEDRDVNKQKLIVHPLERLSEALGYIFGSKIDKLFEIEFPVEVTDSREEA